MSLYHTEEDRALGVHDEDFGADPIVVRYTITVECSADSNSEEHLEAAYEAMEKAMDGTGLKWDLRKQEVK